SLLFLLIIFALLSLTDCLKCYKFHPKLKEPFEETYSTSKFCYTKVEETKTGDCEKIGNCQKLYESRAPDHGLECSGYQEDQEGCRLYAIAPRNPILFAKCCCRSDLCNGPIPDEMLEQLRRGWYPGWNSTAQP
ncbi:hypothetical protein PENTCL1PPCAC_1191, partial [Pristionchus entomophagus]